MKTSMEETEGEAKKGMKKQRIDEYGRKSNKVNCIENKSRNVMYGCPRILTLGK